MSQRRSSAPKPKTSTAPKPPPPARAPAAAPHGPTAPTTPRPDPNAIPREVQPEPGRAFLPIPGAPVPVDLSSVPERRRERETFLQNNAPLRRAVETDNREILSRLHFSQPPE